MVLRDSMKELNWSTSSRLWLNVKSHLATALNVQDGCPGRVLGARYGRPARPGRRLPRVTRELFGLPKRETETYARLSRYRGFASRRHADASGQRRRERPRETGQTGRLCGAR